MSDPETFTPDPRTRALFMALFDKANRAGIDEFFLAWEIEDDPRKAAAVVAGAYMRIAARVAVFASECAGKEPSREQWLSLATEHFDEATKDVAEAFDIAGAKDSDHG